MPTDDAFADRRLASFRSPERMWADDQSEAGRPVCGLLSAAAGAAPASVSDQFPGRRALGQSQPRLLLRRMDRGHTAGAADPYLLREPIWAGRPIRGALHLRRRPGLRARRRYPQWRVPAPRAGSNPKPGERHHRSGRDKVCLRHRRRTGAGLRPGRPVPRCVRRAGRVDAARSGDPGRRIVRHRRHRGSDSRMVPIRSPVPADDRREGPRSGSVDQPDQPRLRAGRSPVCHRQLPADGQGLR